MTQLTIPEAAPPEEKREISFAMESLLYSLTEDPNKPKTREELVRELDLPDGTVRDMILQLRKEHKFILTNGKGYYRLECDETVEAIKNLTVEQVRALEKWTNTEDKRAKTILKSIQPAKRILRIRKRLGM